MPKWNYWLNSGDWLPWRVRALVVTILFLLLYYPEQQIRVKAKIRPRVFGRNSAGNRVCPALVVVGHPSEMAESGEMT